jgi:hypothetical protein
MAQGMSRPQPTPPRLRRLVVPVHRLARHLEAPPPATRTTRPPPTRQPAAPCETGSRTPRTPAGGVRQLPSNSVLFTPLDVAFAGRTDAHLGDAHAALEMVALALGTGLGQRRLKDLPLAEQGELTRERGRVTT